MEFKTQSSSKARLKNDTLGETALKHLYEMYEDPKVTIDEFRKVCEDFVQLGGGKQPKKDEIIREIYSSQKRSVVLKKAQDFILAGMGLGV